MAREIAHPHPPWIVECGTCQAKHPKSGAQCKRNTCKTWPYCWQHLAAIMGLKIAPSTLGPNAGCGLFAVKPNPIWVASEQVMRNDASATNQYAGRSLIFKPNTFVAPYIGEQLDEQQEYDRYDKYDTKGRYLIQKGAGSQARYSIDAISTRTSPARYANHRPPSTAKFVTRRGAPWIQANKRIFEGDEIFVDYGRDFEMRDSLYPDEVRPKQSLCKSRK